MYRNFANVDLNSGSSTGVGYSALDVLEPKAWSSIFGGTNAAGETTKTLLSELEINLRFTVGTQPAPVVIHCFLVTLKRAANVVSMGSLTNDVEYSTMPPGNPESHENVILNEKVFKIHRHRKFTLAQQPEGDSYVGNKGGNPYCSWKDIKWKLYPKMMLKSVQGDWTTLSITDLPPSQRMYILCFFNNSYSAYHDGYAANFLYTCKNMY